MLTICYFTSRKQSCIDWFSASLARETAAHPDVKFRVVIVDFYHNFADDPLRPFSKDGWTLIAPKPTVWQGRYKLTRNDWFAASNARNTALCLATDGWIAFVDDLSVLMPGWLTAVKEAMAGPQRTITCGAYRKVKDLVVDEKGNVVSFTDYPPGHDNRYAYGNDEGPVACQGNWMYGCSLVAPVEAFLSINGYPEAWCDGMGFEDVIAGIMLEKQGYRFVYDRRMMTLESEELHHQLPVMKRSDYGVSPNDKSHAVLAAARGGNGWHPNYFGVEGLRGLRARVLAGEPFPVVQIPQHEWYSKTPLAELDGPEPEPTESVEL